MHARFSNNHRTLTIPGQGSGGGGSQLIPQEFWSPGLLLQACKTESVKLAQRCQTDLDRMTQ
jgi:hypothetical protein